MTTASGDPDRPTPAERIAQALGTAPAPEPDDDTAQEAEQIG